MRGVMVHVVSGLLALIGLSVPGGPTPEEVLSFLDDKDPKKREKLIDALLERPEFVDYWAYKWSDLLLISSRKLPHPTHIRPRVTREHHDRARTL